MDNKVALSELTGKDEGGGGGGGSGGHSQQGPS